MIDQAPSVLDQWDFRDDKKSLDESDPTSDRTGNQATAGSSDMGPELLPQLLQPHDGQKKSSRLPCHIMPLARNKDFYGRQDILQAIDETFFPSSSKAMDEGLQTETDAAITFAICGPGGMGKTQVAAEYFFSRKSKFDAMFWIHADQSIKLAEGFSRIAIELGLVSEDSVDARDQVITRELVKEWLANPPQVSPISPEREGTLQTIWMIIIDNIDTPEALDDYWPLNGPGCVLLTSRDPLAKNSLYLATSGIDLPPFDIEDSSRFLLKLTKKEDDSSGVARRLGGLPLAMTQMAGVIIRRDLTFSEFLETYDEEESHAELFATSSLKRSQSGYLHTLASVWALESLRHGATLLDVCSLLDADGIQEYVLTSYPDSAPSTSYPRTSSTYQKARTELLQSSLISRDRSSQKILVHRMIQDAARARMTPSHFETTFATSLTLVDSLGLWRT